MNNGLVKIVREQKSRIPIIDFPWWDYNQEEKTLTFYNTNQFSKIEFERYKKQTLKDCYKMYMKNDE